MNEAGTPAPLTAQSYKSAYKPIWCPGCGDYSVLSSVTKALAMVAVPPEDVVVVSGIGCSSRIPAYTTCYGFHGVHGRAFAAATGLKVARPDLTVLVAGGDGDGYSIGGNHFLHACRRNVDLTYIVMDNHVYGMTKGQPSPTTEPDWDSKLSPGGTGVRSFHPLVIALASGANFVARAFAGDPNGTAQMIAQAIRHPGFSFVEVLSPCVTFRPEQREWKQAVHPAPVAETDDPARAARRIMTDDGFNIGVLYAGKRKPYSAVTGKRVTRRRTRSGVRVMSPKTTKGAARKAKSAPRTTARKPAAKTKPRTSQSTASATGRAARTAKSIVSAAGKAARAAKKPPAKPAARSPRTLAEFMTQALVMEMEAAQRYADFADAMEMHNNVEVAALFRKMADIEGKHAQQIMAEMGWTTTPAPLPAAVRWEGFEAPETTPIDEVHYLMQPYHALELALANEQRAERFFARLARAATTASVRKAARELRQEEREHVELVRAWMKKVPKPDADWANDPDPPSYTD